MPPLADDHFLLTLGDKTLVLRPTLRAAACLWRKYDGFQALSRALADGNFGACLDLILACTDKHPRATVSEILAARDQLLNFLLVLTGANATSDKPQADKPGKPISFDEYHTKLFQIGTGWLGWTPDDTWNATPAEILHARDGRLELLKAIFGKKEDEQSADIADGTLDGIKGDLNAIGDLTNHVMARAA